MKYLAGNKIQNALTLKISPIQTFYFHTILISKSDTHTTSYVGGKSYPELKKEDWLLNSNLCSIGFEQGHAPNRPQQDPGISRDARIPGLNSNPDPGILQNKIPGFLGMNYVKQNNDFKDFFGFWEKKKLKKSRDENFRLTPSRKIPGSHQSRDENIRLIPSRKIPGSRDFAKIPSRKSRD